MFKKNVQINSQKKISAWRKISLGSWRPTGDSSIYFRLELNAQSYLQFCKEQNIKPHIFMIKALGYSLSKSPHLNVIVKRGKIFERKNIRIFSHIAADKNGENLSGTISEHPENKSYTEIQKEFLNDLSRIQNGDDFHFKWAKKVFKYIPGFLTRYFVSFFGFVAYQLNIHSILLGASQDCFGSLMFTNVGSLGFEDVITPIAPYTHIPIVVSVGAPKRRAHVDYDGQLKILPTIKVNFTVDHRIVDGVGMKPFLDCFQNFVENPKKIIPSKQNTQNSVQLKHIHINRKSIGEKI